MVTHDYLFGLDEHLKSHIHAHNKSTDWCMAELLKPCKQNGEQEMKFVRLPERRKSGAAEECRRERTQRCCRAKCSSAAIGSVTRAVEEHP